MREEKTNIYILSNSLVTYFSNIEIVLMDNNVELMNCLFTTKNISVDANEDESPISYRQQAKKDHNLVQERYHTIR